jgi:hypothetical protein
MSAIHRLARKQVQIGPLIIMHIVFVYFNSACFYVQGNTSLLE